MKLKLNMVVAALALASAGAANAAMDLFPSGSSSLVFAAYDRTGAQVGSFLADLNYNLNTFLPTSAVNNPDTTIQWNFNANTLTVNGSAQPSTGLSWSTAYSSFLPAIQTSELRWAVVAGESVDQRFLTTGTPTANNISSANVPGRLTSLVASDMTAMGGALSSNNSVGTHPTAAAGASFAQAGNAYNGVINNFGPNGNWNNSLTWNATSADNATTRFTYVDNSTIRFGVDDEPLPTLTQFGTPSLNGTTLASAGSVGTFQFNSSSGVLTWQAAPVPEPSGYALALAGLGMLGFMARRRKV